MVATEVDLFKILRNKFKTVSILLASYFKYLYVVWDRTTFGFT